MDRKIARPLLLAPAGSLSVASSVLDAGANAVYAGFSGFARGGVRVGMEIGEIRQAVRLCDQLKASFRVALNAIPSRDEWPAFIDACRAVADVGVSSVILNDVGVIDAVHRAFPHLSICASVGSSTVNAEQASFLRDVGASAVVLPSAVTPSEVPAILATGVEVEVFAFCRAEILIHGSCGLSGYAHASIPDGIGTKGGVSRKRRCAMVCASIPLTRSATDLSAAEMRAFADAGVDVFKVEGREMPPERLLPLIRSMRDRLDEAGEAGWGKVDR